jgi:hypothetical protein
MARKRVNRNFWQRPDVLAVLLDPRVPTTEVARKFGVSQNSAAAARSRAVREARLQMLAGDSKGPADDQEDLAGEPMEAEDVARAIFGKMFDVATHQLQSKNITPDRVRQIMNRLLEQVWEEVEDLVNERDNESARVSELEQELAKLRGGGKS